MLTETLQLTGINHVALVCRDMRETVEFYTNILEMNLVKTIELPNNRGQHFFLDSGGGSTLAFFWFPDAPPVAPGIASMDRTPGASTATAHGSMNHLAMGIPLDKFDTYADRLRGKGIDLRILNHNDGPVHASEHVTPTTWIRSMYFADPNGIWLELAAFTRPFDARDVSHAPARHEDRQRYLVGRS
jgi:catechol 2,3-dioxygenase-like lactoylglutathione lyase family enzyme